MEVPTMTDIVERLRSLVAFLPHELASEAADEIERLRNTIKNCPPVSESEYVRRLEDEIIHPAASTPPR
jgi:hypothetical protein